MATAKIAIRTDTAANWTSNNPTLVAGEQGHETDTGRRKVGDGSTAWTGLDYIVPFPIGAFYTQYPNAASNTLSTAFPSSQEPATLWGGTWTLKWDSDGVFFRTEGGSHTSGRSSGKQDDQFQGHFHDLQVTNRTPDGTSNNAGTSGGSASVPIGEESRGVRQPIGDGTNGTPRTGAETRPTNRLFRIWQRTA